MNLGQKLNLKPGMTVAVLNAPDLTLDLGDEVELADEVPADALLLFVADQAALAVTQDPLVEAARADRLAWVAYPKAGQLGTDLNRDVLWELLAREGIRPVRQISVDGTWSAVRWRPG